MKVRTTLMLLFIFSTASFCQDWKKYADSANLLLQRQNPEQALAYFLTAKDLTPQDSLMSVGHASILNTLGILYRNKNDYAASENFFKKAMDIRSKITGHKHPDYATSCTGLGLLYLKKGEFIKAIPLFNEAKEIRAGITGVNHTEYARCCFLLAICKSYTGDLAEAESLYIEAKDIRERLLGNEHSDYGASCNSLAILYAEQQQLDKASSLFEESKRITGLTLGTSHPDYLAICSNLANLYVMKGQYKKAEELSLELLLTKEKIAGKQDVEFAISCSNLASLYRETGDFDQTEYYMLKAKEIFEKELGNKDPKYAFSCNSLSVLYADMGQHQKALEWGVKARDLRKQLMGPQSPDYIQSLINLVVMYEAIDQYDNAIHSANEAMTVIEKVEGKNHTNYAEVCNNLATVYLAKGETIKVEPLYKQSIEILKNHPNKKRYVEALNNTGRFYSLMGQTQKGEALLKEALTIAVDYLGKNHTVTGEIYGNLARLATENKSFAYASEYFKNAFEIIKTNIEAFFMFGSENEKFSYLKKALQLQQSYFSFLKSYPVHTGEAFNWLISINNIILHSLRAMNDYRNDPALAGSFEKWKEIKEQLAFWLSKPSAEKPVYLKRLTDNADSLEKQLVRLTGNRTVIKQKKHWEEIRNDLKDGEAVIEFISYDFQRGYQDTDSSFYGALLIRKDIEEPVFIDLFERKQLEELINSGMKKGEQGINYLYAGITGHDLYKLVWYPLEKNLQNIHRIYFSPAGELHKLAFAALPVNARELLSEKYHLVQINSSSAINAIADKQVTADDDIALFGGISYDINYSDTESQVASNAIAVSYNLKPPFRTGPGLFSFLSGTGREVNRIREISNARATKVQLRSGNDASEESFKRLSGPQSPGVLHIATHGFFFNEQEYKNKDERKTGSSAFRYSENPLMRSGLALAGANNAWKGNPVTANEDGILTSYEVSNMYLPKTKLAVLSACETGLGVIQGSEGVYGLQRAFKIAGVQNLVMSLWKVPDEETALFMEEFYKNIFQSKTISESFYSAQKLMMQKFRSEPFKWAAWILLK